MATVRSPNYPPNGLGAALELARKVYAQDHRNKVSRVTIAEHLGHETLSGPALAKIGLLRHFGLVEGSGNELRITDDAVHAMLAPEGTPQRFEALERLAMQPQLYRDIRKEFPGSVSTANLTYWLGVRGYTTDAAAKAAKAYLDTMKLVDGKAASYDSEDEPPSEAEMEMTAPDPVTRPARTPMPPLPSGIDWDRIREGGYQLTLDTNRIRVAADVDLDGAKELVARLNKRIALLEEEAEEAERQEDQGEPA